MSDFISRVRRTRAARKVVPQSVTNSDIRHEPSSVTLLSGATKQVNKLIFVDEQNVVLAASDDKKIWIYDINTDGQPKAAFQNHDSHVTGLAQLDTDLVVSVSRYDNLLLTWRVSNIQQVGQWNSNHGSLAAVAKLDHSHIVVCGGDGGVTILKHTAGTSFQIEKTNTEAHSLWINDIAVHQTLFVTCSDNMTAVVWDANSLQVRATLKHNNYVHSVTITDEYIITTSWDYSLQIFENANNFSLQFVLRIPLPARDVQILDQDTIAVACIQGFLGFISLSQKSFLSTTEIFDNNFYSLAVLPDARIAVAGDYGSHSIFSPPSEVQHVVRDCASRLYPSSTLAIQSTHPLRAAWDSVQSGTLSLSDACTNVIIPVNCKRSLDEWCVAHNLLMLAVESGEVPSSRHFNGVEIHWHIVLYQHCAKLAIGEKDINFLASLFRQAEDAGVIATGGAETLIDIIGVRQDILKETRLITNAIYQLFIRQAELDARLKEVLHYQRVQQLTALINAIVGCIPIGGAIATNIVTGSASILNDFQVCGLVESLMSSGKDFTALGSDHLVDRFICRSRKVLSVEEWFKIPYELRKVVEDAALNLGLSMEELRDRLQCVAEMQQAAGENPKPMVNIEEVGSPDSTDDVGQNTTLVTEGVCVVDEQEVIRASPTTEPKAATDLSEEMAKLKETRIEQDSIENMNSEEIAATVSAFLVMYNLSHTEKFDKIRTSLSKDFFEQYINGATFAETDPEVKQIVTEVTIQCLSKTVSDRELRLLSIQFKKFLRLFDQ